MPALACSEPRPLAQHVPRSCNGAKVRITVLPGTVDRESLDASKEWCRQRRSSGWTFGGKRASMAERQVHRVDDAVPEETLQQPVMSTGPATRATCHAPAHSLGSLSLESVKTQTSRNCCIMMMSSPDSRVLNLLRGGPPCVRSPGTGRKGEALWRSVRGVKLNTPALSTLAERTNAELSAGHPAAP